jgi:hypothetical protein
MEKPNFVLELEKQAALAVEKLREESFDKNLPFMIGNMELPKGQFYLEFSDGQIIIATFTENKKEYHTIYNLSETQSHELREKYNLLPCPIYT